MASIPKTMIAAIARLIFFIVSGLKPSVDSPPILFPPSFINFSLKENTLKELSVKIFQGN
jgi:hypothetical protein